MAVRNPPSFLSQIADPYSIITPIEHGALFPGILATAVLKYEPSIRQFQALVQSSTSSSDLLRRIRDAKLTADVRMSLLKIFRRCVSLVCDTETTKKINTVSTDDLVRSFGVTFKPIDELKREFNSLSDTALGALALLLAEYDSRGKQGYELANEFFTWFEGAQKNYSIAGPRGAGPDIQLGTVFPEFNGRFPCDFVIRKKATNLPVAIGFCRYDSTRGGSQSDDRTSGNADKVSKASAFSKRSGKLFKILFVADGPGLAHKDTWQEACDLDGAWAGRVRVSTLKLAPERVTAAWLAS